jgi:lipopolysaccharide export system permease protein
LRSCGYDANRLAIPLLVTSVVLSSAVLVWSETIVPPTASRARSVKDNDIKQLRERGLFNAKSLWYQDPRGFLSIDLYDAVNKVLYGVKLHEMDDTFRLARTLEFAKIAWADDGWHSSPGTEYTQAPDGTPVAKPIAGGQFELAGRPSDFRQKQRRSDEYSYFDLARHIQLMEARGLDTNEFRVDLYTKLALPFAGLVTVFVGFPLAIRGGKRFGLVYRTSLGIVVSFVYWAMLGMCVAAGHAGKLPPFVAAWSANFVFAALGAALFTRADA